MLLTYLCIEAPKDIPDISDRCLVSSSGRAGVDVQPAAYSGHLGLCEGGQEPPVMTVQAWATKEA